MKDSSGNLLSGASVKIDSQIMTTDENGMVSARLLPGTHNYEVELDRYILSKGAFEVPKNSGAALEVVLEAKQYIYDSSNDETGSKFVYDGSEGAALTFSSSKEWQFTQDSSDGGRSFKADFETAYGGNAELNLHLEQAAVLKTPEVWNWTGRAYTYEIKLLDSTEKKKQFGNRSGIFWNQGQMRPIIIQEQEQNKYFIRNSLWLAQYNQEKLFELEN